jgi:hypothetical protein
MFCQTTCANVRFYDKQITFKDPRKDWEIINAWFVKQQNFEVLLNHRDLVLPVEKEPASELAITD